METPRHPRKPWISALEEAGWSLVADRVIHGLAHDFTGRASFLGGLGYLMESPDPDTAAITPLFHQELGSLEEATRLLRLLPDDATEPELLAPGEIWDDLTRLVGVQRGLETVEVKTEGLDSAPAVRLDPTLFIRIVTMALTAGAEGAVLDGGGVVRVKMGVEGGGLAMSIRPFPAGVGGKAEGVSFLPRRILPRERLLACGEALSGEGVELRGGLDEEGQEVLQLSFSPPFSS